MVAQREKTERQRAAPLTIRIAVPVKVVVVDDRPVEPRTVGRRNDDDRRRLDDAPGRDRRPGKYPATARRTDADLDAVVRDRAEAGKRRRSGFPANCAQACSRGRSAAPADAVELAAATGGGTC